MSNLELPSSKKNKELFFVGDVAASYKPKQKSRFHTFVDKILPQFCRDEFCSSSGDMNDTFSVGSAESGILNSIYPEAAEEEGAVDTEGEYILYVSCTC
jgi:hypothetical protein